jgi:hypothetical protein
MPDSPRLTRRPEWTALENHRAGALLHSDLRELFDRDPGRAKRDTDVYEGADVPGLAPSTAALVAAYRTLKNVSKEVN